MPGVEVMAEATEALIAGSAIRAPPAWLKYVIAMLLVALTTFAFYRGEPATDIDSIFVAANLTMLSAAFVGLTFFGFFFDIFASIGFVSLIFGLCRLYAGVQRGRAVGNGDFLPEFAPDRDRWLAVARLRFVPDAQLDGRSAARRRREYSRRLRRFLYAGSDAVMLEGVVERKSWLHDALSDLMVLVWHGESEAAARTAAMHDLARLERQLAEYDARLPDDGSVRIAFACAEIDDGGDGSRPRRTPAPARTGRPGGGCPDRMAAGATGGVLRSIRTFVGRIVMRAILLHSVRGRADGVERSVRRELPAVVHEARCGRLCPAQVRRAEARDLAARHRGDDFRAAGAVVPVAACPPTRRASCASMTCAWPMPASRTAKPTCGC